MKHNPRLNEKLARLPGFADLHPFQPEETVQGALELLYRAAHWLQELTGLPAVCMSPAAGAHGEFCGLLTIRAAHEAEARRQGLSKSPRTKVLVPDSAHGTNPASAALCGLSVHSIPANSEGRVDLEALRARLDDQVAAVMLTNPNTCGLFETEIQAIAAAVHEVGAYFYCDGANFNAIMGQVKIADLGVDAMHINLHKTFSTPHGGGGPGAGPTVFSATLAPYAPLPRVVEEDGRYHLIESGRDAHASYGGEPVGRIKGYHGQFGVILRALAYMMSMGGDGLAQASSDAVLNANYLLAGLKDVLSPAFPGLCMHEALFDDGFLKDSGITTLDFAKALVDEGFHPMTMYFPLVVHGALLIEPTETESKASLDQFITVLRGLVERSKSPGAAASFQAQPQLAPRRRLDETLAARKPILRWTPDA